MPGSSIMLGPASPKEPAAAWPAAGATVRTTFQFTVAEWPFLTSRSPRWMRRPSQIRIGQGSSSARCRATRHRGRRPPPAVDSDRRVSGRGPRAIYPLCAKRLVQPGWCQWRQSSYPGRCGSGSNNARLSPRRPMAPDRPRQCPGELRAQRHRLDPRRDSQSELERLATGSHRHGFGEFRIPFDADHHARAGPLAAVGVHSQSICFHPPQRVRRFCSMIQSSARCSPSEASPWKIARNSAAND